jgi:hypothetical protein
VKYTLARAVEAPESPSPRIATKRLKFFDNEFTTLQQHYVSHTANVDEQIKQYEMSHQDVEMEGLDYWRRHHERYPILAKVVRVLYCFMATSVPCEGLFSDAGYALWSRRTALSADKSEKIVLIQHNEKRM